jgi:hypothetical protein
VPLAFLVDNPIEIFRTVELSTQRGHYVPDKANISDLSPCADHTRPLRIFQRGQLVGLFQLVDSLVKRPVGCEDYSLSAGEISLYIGTPIQSKQCKDHLSKVFFKRVSWDDCHRHSLLVKQLLDPQEWKCSIVLIPDNLCALTSNSLALENLIFRVQIAQMSQVQDEMNEQSAIDQLNRRSSTELLYEQTSHLLGIVRGKIPALVPWQPNTSSLPLQRMIDALYEYNLLKPSEKKVTESNTKIYESYYPYIMVPRLLQQGETGYFSCKWNIGPVTYSDSRINTESLFYFLKKCVEGDDEVNKKRGIYEGIFKYTRKELLDVKEIFKPFVRGRNSSRTPTLQAERVEINEAEFIPSIRPVEMRFKKDHPGATPKTSLWTEGFLDCGFVITRPKWL